MKRLLIPALLATVALAGKKPKPVLAPTQADITKGCVAVQSIIYHPFSAWRRDQGVNGGITNGCGRDVTVRLVVSFYGAQGLLTKGDFEQLVPSGKEVGFNIEPESYTINLATIKSGLVTDVFVSAIP